MDSCSGIKNAVDEVMMIEMMGVSKITHRNEYFDGTTKNPSVQILMGDSINGTAGSISIFSSGTWHDYRHLNQMDLLFPDGHCDAARQVELINTSAALTSGPWQAN